MDDDLGWVRRRFGGTWRLVTAPLYRNAFLIMLSSLAGSALGFVFWLIAARFYAATDVGYAVALFQTITLLGALASLGLGIGIIRYLPETEGKASLVNASATIAGAAALLLGLAFLAVVGVAVPDLAFVLENPVYPAAILVTTLALALPSVYDQTAYAVRRADVVLWRTVAFSLARIGLAVAFATVALTQGRIGIFLALALALVLSVLIEALYLLPRVMPGFRPRVELGLARIRPMIRFSLGNYAADSIGAAGGLLLPVLILTVLGPAGPANVAFFYIATIVAGLLNIIPAAIFTSFYAEASQKGAERHADERKAVLLSVVLLVPGIAVLWVFARELLTVFDPAYAAGAVAALRILLLGSVPVFLNSILVTRIRIRKRSAPLVAGSAVSAAVILGLGYMLLQTNGIEGLAVAFVVGVAAPTPYLYAVARTSFRDEPAPPIEPEPRA